ncbi:hypothetical protein CEXT_717281 [Caerostris extrusa]|uniref:Uncharacterized protein n=1 Tax=Caerostris extrusa TaxID=172846 RepID=A0AAV4Y738_CAEEX|nr:hypothetical protein CEXT_717281 [Caerostris extrusa]
MKISNARHSREEGRKIITGGRQQSQNSHEDLIKILYFSLAEWKRNKFSPFLKFPPGLCPQEVEMQNLISGPLSCHGFRNAIFSRALSIPIID